MERYVSLLSGQVGEVMVRNKCGEPQSLCVQLLCIFNEAGLQYLSNPPISSTWKDWRFGLVLGVNEFRVPLGRNHILTIRPHAPYSGLTRDDWGILGDGYRFVIGKMVEGTDMDMFAMKDGCEGSGEHDLELAFRNIGHNFFFDILLHGLFVLRLQLSGDEFNNLMDIAFNSVTRKQRYGGTTFYTYKYYTMKLFRNMLLIDPSYDCTSDVKMSQ